MMIYVHVPFCASKCAYCDFVSYAGCEGEMERYVDCMVKEMAARPSTQTVHSVFVGGGTPSVLSAHLLTRLLEEIRIHYAVSKDAEVTCEANPGSVTAQWLDAAVNGGVNRLSLGVQAVQDELLARMERRHRFGDVVETVSMAQKAGIGNLSADLIYALPGQSIMMWKESLRRTLELPFSHLSCYGLTVEPSTPFGKLAQMGKLSLPDEDTELAMAQMAHDVACAHGLVQYEVSNYAREGKQCRHNLGYWTRVPYIGIGCGAHSLQDDVRSENSAHLDAYMHCAAPKVDTLSQEGICFEELMLGLRLCAGVVLSRVARTRYAQDLDRFASQGFIQVDGAHVKLTEKGFPVMNTILTTFLP